MFLTNQLRCQQHAIVRAKCAVRQTLLPPPDRQRRMDDERNGPRGEH